MVKGMKRAIIFYSFEGNTREAAEKISKIIGADLIEIKPVNDIPESGPGKFMAGGGKALFGFGSAFYPVEDDLDSYDEFILGTPVWAGRAAPYLMAFLKNEAVRGKFTGVFTLSGSGNNKSCIKQLKKKLPNLRYDVSLCDRVGRDEEETNKAIEFFAGNYKIPNEDLKT